MGLHTSDSLGDVHSGVSGFARSHGDDLCTEEGEDGVDKRLQETAELTAPSAHEVGLHGTGVIPVAESLAVMVTAEKLPVSMV